MVQCRTEKIPEPIRVVVVNNYPPAAKDIASIVATYSNNRRFTWKILYREKTLSPVNNWYSAILEFALPDEVVLLHGDDDIFCSWSLEKRYKAITDNNADILLSRTISRIIFFQGSDSALLDTRTIPKEKEKIKTKFLSWRDLNEWGAVFIGNNCYRNTKKWRQSLNECFEWCHRQHWLDETTRTLMLPYYLPLAVLAEGGSIAGMDEACVIRGGSYDEITSPGYGSPGWNSGFLALCAYGILNSSPLKDNKELEYDRLKQKIMFSKLYLTTYFDKRIARDKRRDTFNQIKIPIDASFFINAITGLRSFVGEIFHLRGWKYRLQARKRRRPVIEILKSLT
ncbi:MAG: hypothetical protein AB2L12_18145 [Smithellaceae bacterium]